VGAPDFNLKWQYIFPRMLDLEHQGANLANVPDDGRPPLTLGLEKKLVSGLTRKSLARLGRATAGLWICLAFLAAYRRDAWALGLLVGPMALTIAFWLGDKRPEAFQLVGVIYPATLCGAACLVASTSAGGLRRGGKMALFAATLTALFVGVRAPRFFGSVQRYAGANHAKSQEFTLRQTDRLVAAIGSEPVEVHVLSLTHLLFTVVEIGNRGPTLYYTPQTFYSAFGYMHWAPPAYRPTQLRIALLSEPRPEGWRVKLRAAPFVLLSRE